jgi:hypothetical protein
MAALQEKCQVLSAELLQARESGNDLTDQMEQIVQQVEE